jgi:hypothetical protein
MIAVRSEEPRSVRSMTMSVDVRSTLQRGFIELLHGR